MRARLHVREPRRIKGFGKVGGGKTIVLRMRVVVIQVKVNTTSGLAGRGENVDVGKFLLEKMLLKVNLILVEMLKTQFVCLFF